MKSSKTARDLLIALAIGDGCVSAKGFLSVRHCAKQKEYLQRDTLLLLKHNVIINC